VSDWSGERLAGRRRPELLVGLNAVVLAVTASQPRVLTVSAQEVGEDLFGMGPSAPPRALPFGSFDEKSDRTLELCVRRSVLEKTQGELGYVEQLYTFADQGRDPRERAGGSRVLSVGYLALVREKDLSKAKNSGWQHCYAYFPWEDWRAGRPQIMDRIEAALLAWSRGNAKRRERVEICFGLGSAGWDAYQVLERYELLYEAHLIAEYWTDRARTRGLPPDGGKPAPPPPAHPPPAPEREVEDQARDEHRGEQVREQADGQGDREAANRAAPEQEQEGGGDDRRQVGVDDGEERLAEAGVERRHGRLAARPEAGLRSQ